MAPPKTDKEIEKEAQHLKKMLSLARKGSINFGIALGKKKPEDLAFFAHQTKNPKSLRKKAREETKNSKGAHGEMTVDGKNLVFVCEDSPPGPIVKAMRIFLRELKVPLRAEFLLPDETVVSAEDREPEAEDAAPRRAPAATSEAVPASNGEIAPAEDAEESGAAEGESAAPDPRLPKMRAEAAEIAKRAAALPQGAARKALGAELRQVVTQIDAGEAEAGLTGLKSMQEALRQPRPPESPKKGRS